MKLIKYLIICIFTTIIFTSCATSTIVDPENLELGYSTDTLGARGSNFTQNRTPENPFRVGIIQYGSHPDLDDCFIGIKRGLDDSTLNISIEYQNGSYNLEDTENISKKMVHDGYDLIIPISTPATIATYNSATYSQTPIVFSAVSDPIGAGVLNSLVTPDSYITGTAVTFDASEQLNLIQTLHPNIKSIGVVYCLFEPNSISQLDALRKEATKRGIEIVSAGVASVDDITEATYSIITRVEVLTNLNDNNITNNLSEILEISNLANIPVYGVSQSQIDMGCIAGQTVDYTLVGQKTAEIAINILSNKDISKVPVYEFESTIISFNEEIMEIFELQIPQQYLLTDDLLELAS